MRATTIAVTGAVLFTAAPAMAQQAQQEVLYAPPPAWVLASPEPTSQPAPEGAPFRIIYSDMQVHVGPDGTEQFQAYRIRILKPEALQLGNISATWNPNAGGVAAHSLRIIREGQAPINVLADHKFQVIQRESNLENAVLNGQLTALLQVPGLQVGDEIEFSATTRQKDPTLGDHSFGYAQLSPDAMMGAFRVRLSWPETQSLNWRMSKDVSGLTPMIKDKRKELVFELRDPKSVIAADGAPARVNVFRTLQYTDFASWTDVSRRIEPLFTKASALKADSPIRAEIAKIAAASTDPAIRAQAALKLVQDRIRYVYVGLGAGNFTPATADQSWERRFGDCKAKTVLLLAILQALDIPAEAVLVDSDGGDGLGERLPSPSLFDHVLVRATIGGKGYWLDGTRLGDGALDTLDPQYFRWVLPLRAGGADLAEMPLPPLSAPQLVDMLDIDATAGFELKAKVTQRRVLRGSDALKLRTALQPLTPEDASRGLQGLWRQQNSWFEPESASWRYDERNAALVITVSGVGKIDWEGNATSGRQTNILGAGFSPPPEFRRPAEQAQDAPWALEFPVYRCWVTSIRLPASAKSMQWDYFSDPMNVTMGGIAYWRASDLRGGIMRTIMSRRALTPEITAAQASEVNKQLAFFNRYISRVNEVAVGKGKPHPKPDAKPPFDETTDWASMSAPCAADKPGPPPSATTASK